MTWDFSTDSEFQAKLDWVLDAKNLREVARDY